MSLHYCSICGKREDSLVDLSANEVMKNTLMNYWKMPSINLESLCVQCVYKINAHKEMTVSLEMKLQKVNGRSRTSDDNDVQHRRKRRHVKKKDYMPKKLDLPPSPSATPTPANGESPTPCNTENLNQSTVLDDPEMTRNDDKKEQSCLDSSPMCLSAHPGSNSSLIVLDGSITPPPYSPHRAASNESTPVTPDISPTRSAYVVEVEDITPEKEIQSPPTPLPLNTADPLSSEIGEITNHESQEKELNPVIEEPSEPAVVQPVVSKLLPSSLIETNSRSNSPSLSSQQHNHSMLQVFSERSESTLATESGGNITRSEAQPMVCQYCSRAYWRKVYFAKHQRRCSARYRHNRSKSAVSFKRRSKSPVRPQTVAEVSANEHDSYDNSVNTGTETVCETDSKEVEKKDESDVKTKKRVYHCSACGIGMPTLNAIRWHRRSHIQTIHCDSCGTEFTTGYDYDFHRVICEAKREVSNIDTAPTNENSNTVQVTVPEGRMTRLRSRAASRAASIANMSFAGDGGGGGDDRDRDRDGNERITKTPKKRKTPLRSRASSTVDRRKRSNPKPNKSKSIGENMVTEDYDDYFHYDNDTGNDDDNDDFDDYASVADTMYSRRMSFTGNWVDDHSNSASCYSLGDDNPFDYDDDLQISTYKEYDLYLLERLKAQIQANKFQCLAPYCNVEKNSLVDIMLHDYVQHYKGAWFYCQKCNRIFTSKVFLDYHLDRQNGGRFICFKCGDCFEFQHQLDRHLLRHTKCINYRCNYCSFEFLTEHKLLQHCETEQHDPNGERRLICCEPSMTIAEVQLQKEHETPIRREYNVHFLKMPRKSSRLPINLSDYKPCRRIGDVEFKSQRNPNCLGWK